jgi:hypothetical protein
MERSCDGTSVHHRTATCGGLDELPYNRKKEKSVSVPANIEKATVLFLGSKENGSSCQVWA